MGVLIGNSFHSATEHAFGCIPCDASNEYGLSIFE